MLKDINKRLGCKTSEVTKSLKNITNTQNRALRATTSTRQTALAQDASSTRLVPDQKHFPRMATCFTSTYTVLHGAAGYQRSTISLQTSWYDSVQRRGLEVPSDRRTHRRWQTPPALERGNGGKEGQALSRRTTRGHQNMPWKGSGY